MTNMQDEPLNLPDPNDRASQEEDHDQPARLPTGSKAIAQDRQALGRLASDDYGYREGCGVEIGLRRLEARPTAELCIDCKHLEEDEKKARRRERSTESATAIARDAPPFRPRRGRGPGDTACVGEAGGNHSPRFALELGALWTDMEEWP